MYNGVVLKYLTFLYFKLRKRKTMDKKVDNVSINCPLAIEDEIIIRRSVNSNYFNIDAFVIILWILKYLVVLLKKKFLVILIGHMLVH